MRVWLCALTVLTACAHGKSAAPATWVEARLAKLKVPASVAAERFEYADRVRQAYDLLDAFAAAQGWRKEAAIPTFESIELFDEQAAMWRRMLELNALPLSTPLPTPGLAAGIERGVLLALTQAEYERVAPTYAVLPGAWSRLVAHELTHRLHVNVLDGREDAMGPQWFFEALATLGSGQDFDVALGLEYRSATEALESAHDTKSPHAYARWAAALRFFATKTTLDELVARAASPDFEAWLTAR
ncbi:MAG: hypothetical protein JNK82_13195 [Myxococcaceae bacterium]|nr:hypothetical protein [Myxococcaceae bacterium]